MHLWEWSGKKYEGVVHAPPRKDYLRAAWERDRVRLVVLTLWQAVGCGQLSAYEHLDAFVSAAPSACTLWERLRWEVAIRIGLLGQGVWVWHDLDAVLRQIALMPTGESEEFGSDEDMMTAVMRFFDKLYWRGCLRKETAQCCLARIGAYQVMCSGRAGFERALHLKRGGEVLRNTVRGLFTGHRLTISMWDVLSEVRKRILLTTFTSARLVHKVLVSDYAPLVNEVFSDGCEHYIAKCERTNASLPAPSNPRRFVKETPVAGFDNLDAALKACERSRRLGEYDQNLVLRVAEAVWKMQVWVYERVVYVSPSAERAIRALFSRVDIRDRLHWLATPMRETGDPASAREHERAFRPGWSCEIDWLLSDEELQKLSLYDWAFVVETHFRAIRLFAAGANREDYDRIVHRVLRAHPRPGLRWHMRNGRGDVYRSIDDAVFWSSGGTCGVLRHAIHTLSDQDADERRKAPPYAYFSGTAAARTPE